MFKKSLLALTNGLKSYPNKNFEAKLNKNFFLKIRSKELCALK